MQAGVGVLAGVVVMAGVVDFQADLFNIFKIITVMYSLSYKAMKLV